MYIRYENWNMYKVCNFGKKLGHIQARSSQEVSELCLEDKNRFARLPYFCFPLTSNTQSRITFNTVSERQLKTRAHLLFRYRIERHLEQILRNEYSKIINYTQYISAVCSVKSRTMLRIFKHKKKLRSS